MTDQKPEKPAKPLTKAQKVKEERKKRAEAAYLAAAIARIKIIKDAEKLENSFYEFVKAAWPQFDPATFVENWHLRDLCDHMEAVARGHIRRFLANVPPRTAKSNIISVCFPAWVWTQREKTPLMGPQASFFYASYAETLALEHSLKCRRLIESPWYQERWGTRFRLVSDRNRASHFENDKGGYRMASSVDARATGFGGMYLLADDPHLVKEAESDTVRDSVVKWWSETMPSRLNDRRVGAMIVIMQRVHEDDLAGYILDNEMGYVHFCVPMAYEPCWHMNVWRGNEIVTVIGEDDCSAVYDEDIFWQDPRIDENELLWPERYPASEVAKIEQELGPYAFAGQFQQNPIPRGGGLIRQEWWQTWDDDTARENGVKPGQYPPCEFIVASLDTALTEKEENDFSALTIWGVWSKESIVPIAPSIQTGNSGIQEVRSIKHPQMTLMFAWQERMQIHQLVTKVGTDCKKFKVDRLLIEDKAAGHSVSQELVRLFGTFDFGVELVNPRTGFIKSADKIARLQSCVHLWTNSLVWAPDKEWVLPVKKQCAALGRIAHDDLADTCSQALLWLRRVGLAQLKEERAVEVEEEHKYQPKSAALYPA